MKIGMRKPNLKKSISARSTGKAKRAMKKAINPLYGKKGMGLVNDPKKAIYNKVYNKTTFGVDDIIKNTNNKKMKRVSNADTVTIVGISIILIIFTLLAIFIFTL